MREIKTLELGVGISLIVTIEGEDTQTVLQVEGILEKPLQVPIPSEEISSLVLWLQRNVLGQNAVLQAAKILAVPTTIPDPENETAVQKHERLLKAGVVNEKDQTKIPGLIDRSPQLANTPVVRVPK